MPRLAELLAFPVRPYHSLFDFRERRVETQNFCTFDIVDVAEQPLHIVTCRRGALSLTLTFLRLRRFGARVEG